MAFEKEFEEAKAPNLLHNRVNWRLNCEGELYEVHDIPWSDVVAELVNSKTTFFRFQKDISNTVKQPAKLSSLPLY